MKPISFGDGYRLGLIAKNLKGINRKKLAEHLDSDAKEIATAIITPGTLSKNKDAQSAAKDLVKLAEKRSKLRERVLDKSNKVPA